MRDTAAYRRAQSTATDEALTYGFAAKTSRFVLNIGDDVVRRSFVSLAHHQLRHAAGMATAGTVRSWHTVDGWGVIESDATPGGCWAHYSCLRIEGFRELSDGQEVEFEWEQASQDGYSFRATAACPRGDAPVEPSPAPAPGPTSAFWSAVTIDGIDANDWPPSDPGGWRRQGP